MDWDDILGGVNRRKWLSQLMDPLADLVDARSLITNQLQEQLRTQRFDFDKHARSQWARELSSLAEQHKATLKSLTFGLGPGQIAGLPKLGFDEKATTRLLDGVQEQLELIHGRRWRLDEIAGMPDAATIAEQLSLSLKSFLPRTLADQWRDLVSADHIEVLQRAAEDAASRLEEDWEDGQEPATADELQEQIAGANLDETTVAIQKAVAAAVTELERRGAFGGWKAWKSIVVLFLLGQLVEQILDVYLWPTIARLYQRDGSNETTPAGTKTQTESLPAAVRGRIVLTTGKAAVHAGPHSTHQVLGAIGQGKILHVLNRRHGWVRVRYVLPDGDGAEVTGWVRAKKVRPMELEARRLLLQAIAEREPRE